MCEMCAKKSKMILDTLKNNIESFKNLLDTCNENQTKQNLLRAIVLFLCSGIDAIVKQLIIESLESVIERDKGAQGQLRQYIKRRIKRGNDLDYELLAELLTSSDTRRTVIGMLKEELSFDSLQSAEQLYKVASYFNIPTEKLLRGTDKDVIKEVFSTRNIIVHQMDVDFQSASIKYYSHDIDEVEKYCTTLIAVAEHFIEEVNDILKRDVTSDYAPLFSVQNESLIFHSF